MARTEKRSEKSKPMAWTEKRSEKRKPMAWTESRRNERKNHSHLVIEPQLSGAAQRAQIDAGSAARRLEALHRRRARDAASQSGGTSVHPNLPRLDQTVRLAARRHPGPRQRHIETHFFIFFLA